VGRLGAVLLATSVVGVPAAGGTGATEASAGRIEPSAGFLEPSAGFVVDVAAPWFWDGDAGMRAGADADRFELDELPAGTDLTDWYHVAYVDGGSRLRVRDHVPSTTTPAGAAIGQSENVAWHAATHLLAGGGGMAGAGEVPEWARPHTGTTDGSSAGLVFALADLDLVTPGRLGGDLRVAGTGAIGSDGAVTAVRMVDAKLAAARTAEADVFFTPERASAAGATAIAITSHTGRPTPDRPIGDWLATTAYEAAGRAAVGGTAPGAPTMVVVDDIRRPSPGCAAGRTSTQPAPWLTPPPLSLWPPSGRWRETGRRPRPPRAHRSDRRSAPTAGQPAHR
jgi:hypothetical protein